MSVRLCVFDAYGTLFDVSSAVREAATAPGGDALAAHWRGLAADWRARQLSYTWLRAVMGAHADFWQVTQDALDWALEARGLAGDTALRDRLLGLYRRLAAFPEAPAMLAALKARGRAAAILSNGEPGMLAEAIASAGLGGLFEAVLSAEEAGVFKPARAVYDLVVARFGTAPEEVLFVSANGWDAAAGAHYGFETVWVNRTGEPMDRLPARPHHVLPDLSGIPDLAEAA